MSKSREWWEWAKNLFSSDTSEPKQNARGVDIMLFVDADGNVVDALTGPRANEYVEQQRVSDCDCGLIFCECKTIRQHTKECRYIRALTCPVAIQCEKHGEEVCPECDACDCKGSEI